MVILSKIIFSYANFQKAGNICAKFQNDCLKTLGEVDYTNFFCDVTDGQTDRQTGQNRMLLTIIMGT